MRMAKAAIVLVLLAGAVGAARADRPKLAIMRFQAQSAPIKDKVDQLSAKLSGALARTGKFTVLPDVDVRQQQERLATELKTSDPSVIAPKLGKNLNADWVFIPYATFEGDFISITVTVINITTSDQPSGYEVETKGGLKELYDSVQQVADKAKDDAALFATPGGDTIPAAAAALLEQADVALQSGKTQRALDHTNAARKAAPDNPAVLVRCIGLYKALGQPEEALQVVTNWIDKARPDHPQYRAMVRTQIELQDRIDEFKKLAEQTAQLLREFTAAADKKDGDAAVAAYEKLVKLTPEHPSLESLRKKLKELGRDPADGGPTLALDLGGGVKLELVRIQAGEFWMGSPDSEEDRDSDELRHRVRISKAFYMGKYEVTQAQWQAVMGNNPSGFNGDSNLPVEQVSWDDCQEFCRKLSQKSGKTVRLPTEAEWEYACRAGSTTRFSNGDSDDGLGNVAWYDGNSDSKTHPVGGKRANAWGLFDMHGNVWEWCQDWKNDYPSGSVTDPTGPGSGSVRVLRGGSWIDGPRDCRSAIRYRLAPGSRSDNFGFRVVSGTP